MEENEKELKVKLNSVEGNEEEEDKREDRHNLT